MKINNPLSKFQWGLILLFCTCFHTENLFSQAISLGIKGGLNLSSLSIETATYQPGYQFGGFSKVMLSKKLGLQTEILFVNQNPRIDDQRVSISYIQIPILIRYNLNSFINLQAGPQYNMLLDTMDPSESMRGTLQNKDLCLALGIGFDLPLGLSTSIRFINDFGNVGDGTGDISSDVVQLSASFTLFDFRKH